MKAVRVCAELNVHQDLPFNSSMSECSFAVQKNGHGEPGAQLLDARGMCDVLCVGLTSLSFNHSGRRAGKDTAYTSRKAQEPR